MMLRWHSKWSLRFFIATYFFNYFTEKAPTPTPSYVPGKERIQDFRFKNNKRYYIVYWTKLFLDRCQILLCMRCDAILACAIYRTTENDLVDFIVTRPFFVVLTQR